MALIDINGYGNASQIDVGEVRETWSANGDRVLRYYIDLRHREMKIHKDISAPDIYSLQVKVDALLFDWSEKFKLFQRKQKLYAGKEAAERLTAEAGAKLEAFRTILEASLTADPSVDWEGLKDHSRLPPITEFPEAKPAKPRQRAAPIPSLPDLTLWERLFGLSEAKRRASEEQHTRATAAWKESELQDQTRHAEEISDWNRRRDEHVKLEEAALDRFSAAQTTANAKIDELAAAARRGDPQAVIEEATLILDHSDYGDLFESSFFIDYEPDSRTLLVEYELPSIDDMPKVKAVRFVAASRELKETLISERELKANFDSACYQICLRTLSELFDGSSLGTVDRVLFNGVSAYVDRSTGRDTSACIMSVLVDRVDFEKIDLARVEPKTCFKSLKGVSASTLSALAPIPPVMKLDRNDSRFVEARETAASLDDSTNLAAMDWEDFEHLVRELFEKEFASRGGDVKITQSSSDGGVDAVAFDPDPITGGKIVIQAKRYTRTVGVAAVRDLYGTLQHEGASRGLLITTADYGPDAHKFAAGKPITLLTGANLLHLLSKHGYNAKIDLRQARKDLNLSERAARPLR